MFLSIYKSFSMLGLGVEVTCEISVLDENRNGEMHEDLLCRFDYAIQQI
jgi:hypothetical protein